MTAQPTPTNQSTLLPLGKLNRKSLKLRENQ